MLDRSHPVRESAARAARALGVALTACAVAAGSAAACSVCLCGDTSASNLGVSAPRGGEWRFTIENRSLSKSNALEGDPTGLEFEHENRLSLMAAYAVSDKLSVGATVPYLDRRIVEQPSGERTTTTRLSDVDLQARYRVRANVPTERLLATYVLADVTVPVGANDLRDASGDLLDEHAQAGTGAWAATAGLAELFHTRARWIYGSAAYRVQSANGRGYRYGNSLLATVEAGQRAGSRLALVGGIAARATARDHTGAADAPLLADSGGRIAFLTPAVDLAVANGVLVKAQAYLPVWSDLHGTQHEDANLIFSVTYAR